MGENIEEREEGWEQVDKEAMVYFKGLRCLFYSDRQKKWGSWTDTTHGMVLLRNLGVLNSSALAVNKAMLDKLGSRASKEVLDAGLRIYADKSNPTKNKITWSQPECVSGHYRHCCHCHAIPAFPY